MANCDKELLRQVRVLKPKLEHWEVAPEQQVAFAADSTAWQGYAAIGVGPVAGVLNRPFAAGERFLLDFGEHSVGRLKLAMRTTGKPADAPVRLKLLFAELPQEIAEADRPFTGYLCRSWIQEETVTIDEIPATVVLPRRYAMRYLLLEVVGTPDRLVFDDIRFIAQSAVGRRLPPPPPGVPERLARLDAIALRTLRDCMQELFEDGPKRDRRLWLGDLYLQAKVDRVSFRRFDLVERSIALLAAFTSEQGQVVSSVYEKPVPAPGNWLADYPLLFPALIREHTQAAGGAEFAARYYDTALRQLEPMRQSWGDTPCPHSEHWAFIDWSEKLDKTTALAGVYLFGLRNAAALAELLGRESDRAALLAEAEKRSLRLRRELRDPRTGLFVSGPDRQLSYASQIWMILGGAVPPEDAGTLLRKLASAPEAIRPVTPFLHHFLLEAWAVAGEFEQLFRHLQEYWGKMADCGADTFQEVFDPDNPYRTPYGDVRLSSACHAWSCAPAYFIRRYRDRIPG